MQYRFPLLQLVPVRVRHFLSRINKLIWESEIPLEPLIASDSGQNLDLAPLLDYKIIENGTYFATPDWTHKWFKLNCSAAGAGEKGRRYLYWNVQGESTVYLNGQVFCGLDIAHPWCLLPDEDVTLYLECGTYQTAVWTMAADDELTPVDEYGLRFHNASIRVRNETAWAVYHDLDVLVQLMDYHLEKEGIGLLNKGLKKELDICTPFLRRLIRTLDEAVNIYELEGLEAFAKALKNIYSTLPAEEWGMNMGIVGNSHIDLVWMWPESITWKKAVHTLSTMVKLSDTYPEMVFTISQPPLMENVQKAAPEIYEKVRKKIESRQWEATGVMEVEADTLIPCGEGLIRSILVGKKRFRDLFGREGDTLWLPDVFGYSQCIPQLCSLTGIKNFFTTKMTWSEVNKFPHNSFIWESSDGSKVLSHLANCGYVSPMNIKQAIDNANMYKQSDIHSEMLLAIGHGDGGGGVTEGQCERVRRMKNLATVPKARWTCADDFFDRLRDKSEKLPVYKGEMYLEYHRGTYTGQSEFKRLYRACEKAMQAYELACVLTGNTVEAENEWKRILFSQFHDAIPGSSIQEVYDRMNPELKNLTGSLNDKTVSLLEQNGKRELALFNPTALESSAVVEIPLEIWNRSFPSGDPVQKTGESALIFQKFRGAGVFPVLLDQNNTTDLIIENTHMRNGHLSVGFDNMGRIFSLNINGEPLKLTGPGRLVIHEDHPVNFEAWDIDRNATWLGRESGENLDLQVIEKGPLRGIVRGEGIIGENSHFSIDYILERDSPALKIQFTIDWQEKEKLLRFEIPTDYKGQNALYGSPFGSVLRSQSLQNSHDAAMWEVPGSRWMAVINDRGNGLAIVTEAKYGFSCLDGRAGISLLRSPRTPDIDSIRKEEIFADQGSHKIQFALTGHNPSGSVCTAAHLAETIYSRPIICHGGEEVSLFTIDKPGSLVPSWVKPGYKDSTYLIRFHEILGDSGEVTIIFKEKPHNLYLADILEEENSKPIGIDDFSYTIPYRPYQILTLVVTR